MPLQPTRPANLSPDPDILATMSPVMLDGFLTAVLLTPGGIPEERWQAELWLILSDTDIDLPAMKALVDSSARRMAALRKLLDASLAARRSRKVSNYQPAFMTAGGGPTAESLDTWLHGFWRAARLKDATWRKLLAGDQTRDVVMPLDVGLTPDRNGGVSLQNPEIFAGSIAQIPFCILQLRANALERPVMDDPETHPKLSRNGPCPCGSGQKYKRCCSNG